MLPISSATPHSCHRWTQSLQTLTLRKTKDRCPHSQRRRILWCRESPSISLVTPCTPTVPRIHPDIEAGILLTARHTCVVTHHYDAKSLLLLRRVSSWDEFLPPLGVLPGSHPSARPCSAYVSHVGHVPTSPAPEGEIRRTLAYLHVAVVPTHCTSILCRRHIHRRSEDCIRHMPASPTTDGGSNGTPADVHAAVVLTPCTLTSCLRFLLRRSEDCIR